MREGRAWRSKLTRVEAIVPSCLTQKIGVGMMAFIFNPTASATATTTGSYAYMERLWGRASAMSDDRSNDVGSL